MLPTMLSSISNLFILIMISCLGCFTFSFHHHRRRRRHDSTIPPKKTHFSFLKRLFCFSSSSMQYTSPPPPSIPSPSSSTRSLNNVITAEQESKQLCGIQKNHDALLADCYIHPCYACGEIFQTTTLLEHHQSTKHAVSELIDGENIVRIIFKMGWPEKTINSLIIHRILKIHNSHKVVAGFEEYRETVKSRAAAAVAANYNQIINKRDIERCIADGNELLRFYCTTFICDLLQYSSICNQQYCSACGIIRNGFSQKMDGISTLPTSWRAHKAIPDDLEEEFSFMHVQRALLVCRVIAGRVGYHDPAGLVDPAGDFDSSLMGNGGFEDDELLVFNPRAVLPCFLIVYKT